MKTNIKRSFITVLMLLISVLIINGQTLSEKLDPLKPFLNKPWKGILKSPDGKDELIVNRTFEIVKNGNVIKCTKINKELDSFGEGFFYWNDIEKKIAFFFIESKGVFQIGFVTVENNIVTIEGTMTWPQQLNPNVKQSYDFKNTFEFTSDGKMIDKWFQNAFGPWQPGHVIEFN